MAVPTFDKFIEPVLRFLANHPEGARAREAQEAAAVALQLTEDDRNVILPSGVQAVYKNRAGWAHDRLKRAGLSSTPRRGHWVLTEQGIAYAATHPAPLPSTEVERLATEFMDVRLGPASDSEPLVPYAPVATESNATLLLESPDDRLGKALAELRSTTAAELAEALSNVSPDYFETIVLDLLHKMGYGANRSDLLRVGRAGDGGIDGVISLDKLGLEKVYVQAKRWQGTVGRPDVQAFYGALAGNRANKGVFITTSGYTAQAIEFARSVERVVLVDGAKLGELMIDHEVGVTSRTIKVPKLDSDYFDEEST